MFIASGIFVIKKCSSRKKTKIFLKRKITELTTHPVYYLVTVDLLNYQQIVLNRHGFPYSSWQIYNGHEESNMCALIAIVFIDLIHHFKTEKVNAVIWQNFKIILLSKRTVKCVSLENCPKLWKGNILLVLYCKFVKNNSSAILNK